MLFVFGMEKAVTKTNPWRYVPLLYFMQAIPSVFVTEIAPIVYKNFGVANDDITRWTGIIGLPWVIKLLWGPLIDLNGTKRRWLLLMQTIIVAGLLCTAAALHTPNFFGFSLATLAIVAIASATCDIATDGYYLIALTREEQAAYVGLNTTFFRLGRLLLTGPIVALAGWLMEKWGKNQSGTAQAWSIALVAITVLYGVGNLTLGRTLPHSSNDVALEPNHEENRRNLDRTGLLVIGAIAAYFALSSVVKLSAELIAGALIRLPLLGDLTHWRLSSPAKVLGFTTPFSGNQGEMIQFALCAVIATGCLRRTRASLSNTVMGDAFSSFFRQPGIVPILLFMLFYRFGEAMITGIAPLFFLDPVSKGGLGYTNEQVGLVNGTVGVLGIVLGGIMGGLVISKMTLRRAFWPLVAAMHAPNLLYVWVAIAHPPMPFVAGVAFVEQFGYGIGFSAYMLYLMWVAQRGEFRTAHYAIATGLGALFIRVAGILSGILQVNFGYVPLFIIVVILTIPGMLTLRFVPMEQEPTR